MKKISRWAVSAHLPMTQTLHNTLPMGSKKSRRTNLKSEIASERLCDDALQRLSPYLLTRPPVDILDLWPGCGLLSSKVNDFLKPRRHVMIEPDLDKFSPLLKPLAQSRPCYELLSMDIQTVPDWRNVLLEHFPEQSMANCDTTGVLARNHTLLVLANPPPSRSKKDHYTPARWLSSFMEACLRQAGLHTFGGVRLLASLPVLDSQGLIPRTVADRKRPALSIENVALHAFEVASAKGPMTWVNSKGWDVVTRNAARVAQREAEQHISVPPGREIPPLPMAPKSPDPGKTPVPYTPRLNTEHHDRLVEVLRTESPMMSIPTPKGRRPNRVNPKRSRAVIQLNQDNRFAWFRQELVAKHVEIDNLMKKLSRTAAKEGTTAAMLQPMLDKIESIKTAATQQALEVHYEPMKQASVTIDDQRASLHSGNFDDGHLLWDRRPFEPLCIQSDELYPRESERSLIYFEPDANAPALQKLTTLPPEERHGPFRLAEALSLTIGVRSTLSVAEFLQLTFPDREINDVVKAVPSLATFAAKTPKPDFDSLPKTVHGKAGADGKVDPAVSYQENLDYNLSDVRVRSLSTDTLWDIYMEYQKVDMKLSPMQLNRLLGGTLTSFRSGDYLLMHNKLC